MAKEVKSNAVALESVLLGVDVKHPLVRYHLESFFFPPTRPVDGKSNYITTVRNVIS
jgi:hypothetical protein